MSLAAILPQYTHNTDLIMIVIYLMNAEYKSCSHVKQ